jgi:predicted  nucleic acid-binding Zn-ribbon protein
MLVTFRDWLELLGIDGPIDDLLAGGTTLTEARSRAGAARDTWPSVSQDYVAVLDELEPFFGEVADVIDEQLELVDRFNAIMVEFGLGITRPVDRLLSAADVEEMRRQHLELAEVLSAIREQMQRLEEQIEVLSEQLNDFLAGIEEGDPFADEEIADLAEELQELYEAMEAQDCLPS